MYNRAGLEAPLSTTLTTARLVLSPSRASDVGAIRTALRKNRMHLAPWQPKTTGDPTSLSSVTAGITRDRKLWRAGTQFAFWVFEADRPDVVVGRVSLSGVWRSAYHGAYLGYWVDGDCNGRGFATEAVAAVLAFAFGPLGLHRVQAAIMPNNLASLRVIEKLGFRREGFAQRYLQIAGKWEDHVLFAMLSDELPGGTGDVDFAI